MIDEVWRLKVIDQLVDEHLVGKLDLGAAHAARPLLSFLKDLDELQAFFTPLGSLIIHAFLDIFFVSSVVVIFGTFFATLIHYTVLDGLGV